MKTQLFASTLALTALVSAQAAQAQEACVEPADLNDTITYAAPLALDAAMTSCGDQYSANGFMRSESAEFADRFREKQDAAWPGTFRLLQVFMNQRAGENGESDAAMSAMISAMPEEQLRPFVDALITQMIAGEIKPKTCGDIENILELIAPLPVENISSLVTLIMEMVELDDPAICSVESK